MNRHDRHAIADTDALHISADAYNFTGVFVTENGTGRQPEERVLRQVQITAANAASGHANDHLAGSRCRVRDALDDQGFPQRCEYGGFHAGQATAGPREGARLAVNEMAAVSAMERGVDEGKLKTLLDQVESNVQV